MQRENRSETNPSRYVVGFDLGTTNSAVCYVDTQKQPWRVSTFAVPQLVAPGQVEAREILPSFHYQPAAGEVARGALKCPWDTEELSYAVGVFARDQGTLAPGRLINSAKSWLCHSGVDRTAGLLPWHGAPDVDRLSPLEVSARYLAHVRAAWDARFPRHPLGQQDFVLTLPASFDEVARELTVKAAALAGLPRVVLIEEPQAAFYAWIYAHQDDWEQAVRPGQKILICDIGGGTSDFTLLRVRRGEGGKIQFHRVAVGDHLILGGDNFDLALAQHVERRLVGEGHLEPRQWAVLVGSCRQLKETLLGQGSAPGAPGALGAGLPTPPERLTLNLPRAGTRLIGGGLQIELSRQEVLDVLLEGFFPRVTLDEKPRGGRSGFREFGLPYAPDPAITRYLAAFLTAHRHVAEEEADRAADHDPARPDVVLFNGGVFLSPVLRERLLQVLRSWFQGPRQLGDAPSPWPSPKGRGDSDASPSPWPSPKGRGDSDAPPSPWPSPKGRGDPDAPPSPWPSPTGRGDAAMWEPLVLDNDRLDLAVARGAAYYGMVRRGEGVRIAAGLARTYYIGVEGSAGIAAEGGSTIVGSAVQSAAEPVAAAPAAEPAAATTAGFAVCLLPAGIEPGHDIILSQRQFELLVSEPVEFPLYVSSTRLVDRPGEVVPIDRERMTPLPPIRTVLRTRKKGAAEVAQVQLHARLTEIGTLDLWCSEIRRPRSWRLQFDVRSATQTDVAAHQAAAEREGFVDEATWQQCRELIIATFGAPGSDKPEGLAKRLVAVTGTSRQGWPTSLCRRIWEALMEVEAGRRRSQVHEARWLNLLGFALRPGYGLAVDDWRVAETWRTLQGKFVHAAAMCRGEGWILWRRIGGGLAAGQQQAVAEPLLGPLRSLHRQLTSGKGRGEFSFASHETAEIWRLLGSLELLGVATKIELGNMLLDMLPKRKMESVRPAMLWAVGRIAARAPLYGPLNTVVPAEVAGQWFKRLLDVPGDDPAGPLAVMQLARRTGDRYRDLPQKARDTAIAWLARAAAPAHFIALVRDVGSLDDQEQGLIFGEALPKGLRIV